MSTLPFASLRRTAWRLVSTAVKSGARWPGLISGPTRVSGVPLRVTTPFLSCAMTVSSWSREMWGVPQSIARALHCARMGVRLARLLVAALAPWALAAPAGAGSSVVILSTTTSTQDSGLLDVLVPRFEKQTGYTVKTISVGTGQALALAARGEADVVLCHAPSLEKRYLADGTLTHRRLVMYNDFVLVGPAAAQCLFGDGGQSGERAARQHGGRPGVRRLHGVTRGPANHPDLRRRPARPTAVRSDRRPARGGCGAMTLLLDGVREAIGLLVGGDGEIWSILWLSLQVSGSATLISLLLGVPAGTALALTRFPGRGLVVSAVNSGMGLPPVVVGLFVTILLWRSGPLGALEILYTPAAIVVAQAVIAAPIVTGITLAAVQQVPREFRLQLLALGASRVQMVWVVLREARLPMLAAVMAGFGGVISEIGASMMVGGNIKGQTRTLTTAMVLETSKGDFDVAIALSLLLLVLVFLVNWALTSIQQRRAI